MRYNGGNIKFKEGKGMIEYSISKRELQRGYEFLIKLFNNVNFDNHILLEHIRGTIDYVAELKEHK